MTPPTVTPDSDIPPPDWREHEDGFEDGFLEEWDDPDPDSGGYDDSEGW